MLNSQKANQAAEQSLQNDTKAQSAKDILDLDDDAVLAMLQATLNKLINHVDLSYSEMTNVMLAIMQGRCPDAIMGAILTALRIKGETIDEITAAASVMIELADKITLNSGVSAVDIVGTGGDGANLFNVSTASAFVAATAGVVIAKHGNRGVSSKSGSSDLLEMAGIRLDLTLNESTKCIHEKGIGFLFAPNHHKAMKYAIGVRRELKVRTIFNILGPLTNPAGVKNSVIGVFDSKLCQPLAQVFKNLGANHVMVISAKDGLDEFSLANPTHVAELKNGEILVYDVAPEDVGIRSQSLEGLSVESASDSLALIKEALLGKNTDDVSVQKARDIIALNAGAAIYVAGIVSSYADGVNLAKSIIQDGTALTKLEDFANYTQALKS